MWSRWMKPGSSFRSTGAAAVSTPGLRVRMEFDEIALQAPRAQYGKADELPYITATSSEIIVEGLGMFTSALRLAHRPTKTSSKAHRRNGGRASPSSISMHRSESAGT